MTLGIYGMGGAGRSVLEVVEQVNESHSIWEDIVFIDDNYFGHSVQGIKVYSFEQLIEKNDSKNIQICISVGEPEDRKCLKDKIEKHGFLLTNIIHPNTHISESSKYSNGLILREGSRISSGGVLGANNSFENYCIFGHDSKMGSDCQLSAFTVIAGNCKVGNNVFFGVGSAVMQGLSIGSGSIISMGAMVFKDVPEGVIVSGNPARIIQDNIDKKVF